MKHIDIRGIEFIFFYEDTLYSLMYNDVFHIPQFHIQYHKLFNIKESVYQSMLIDMFK